MLFSQFKGDFHLAFVHTFGFNYPKAATFFCVTPRTIKRWLHQNNAPMAVLRCIDSMSRGYLPDYEPFSSWYIDGTHILTPWGKVNAFDVEFLNTYKWNARHYAQLFQHNKQLSQLKSKNDDLYSQSYSHQFYQYEVSYGY